LFSERELLISSCQCSLTRPLRQAPFDKLRTGARSCGQETGRAGPSIRFRSAQTTQDRLSLYSGDGAIRSSRSPSVRPSVYSGQASASADQIPGRAGSLPIAVMGAFRSSRDLRLPPRLHLDMKFILPYQLRHQRGLYKNNQPFTIMTGSSCQCSLTRPRVRIYKDNQLSTIIIESGRQYSLTRPRVRIYSQTRPGTGAQSNWGFSVTWHLTWT